MLDMGFLPTIERIVAALPANRQNLFLTRQKKLWAHSGSGSLASE